jgi:hypothetical protein
MHLNYVQLVLGCFLPYLFLTPQHEQSKGMDQLNTAYVYAG